MFVWALSHQVPSFLGTVAVAGWSLSQQAAQLLYCQRDETQLVDICDADFRRPRKVLPAASGSAEQRAAGASSPFKVLCVHRNHVAY